MSELTADEKQRKGLRGLFRFLKRRDSEAALREAIEEFIEESETTDADQTPIAPGRKVSDQVRNGRRTARFVSDAPILTFFSIQSARYAEARRRHAGVND